MKISTWVRICLLALVLCVLGLFLWRPVWLFYWGKFRTGNEIVSRIEAFRTREGHLPETLRDVGFDDPDSKLFYRLISSDEYCVWFGTSLGESETYSSRSKQWE